MRNSPCQLLFLLFALIMCGTFTGCSDYPPIDPSLSFNIDHSVSFALSNSASIHKDTALDTTANIDTNDYVKQESSAYLLKAAQVGRISLTSSDPAFTLDELGPIAILIGTDTVATDTLPQGTVDTNFTLTHSDITNFMRDTSFTATLKCDLQSVAETPVVLTCSMTIIYVGNARP